MFLRSTAQRSAVAAACVVGAVLGFAGQSYGSTGGRWISGYDSNGGTKVTSGLGGFSYEGCNDIYGEYSWTADGPPVGGYQKYDTYGYADHTYYPSCDSWNDGPGAFQYTGYRYRSGTWSQIPWTKLRDDTGTYSLEFNDVRDIRFRICNLTDGKNTGCGVVN